MQDTGTPKINDAVDVMLKIGGPRSQWYHACYVQTKTMLVGDTEKRRSTVFYGEPGSSKTRIAKYSAGIFDSHWKNETKGIYDEKISIKEAHT